MAWSAHETVEALSAAGEPTRLRILALLAREELAVLELSQILDQSQPRVSRHLKLLAEAGLVQRFPDGSWVFYGLAWEGPGGALVRTVLDELDAGDPLLKGDSERLAKVQAARAEAAQAYFERNAARWDDIRSLYVDEADVEAAILQQAGPGPFTRVVDLGTGAGRMLTLVGPQARRALGLDLSQQMLNIARRNVAEAGLRQCELRHGDIRSTGLPDAISDLVVVHQVLHYLNEPAAAVAEAARLVAPGGKLLIVDFAPHELDHLREQHQHRRLGFSDEEIGRWMQEAGLEPPRAVTLAPPKGAEGPKLTVKIWSAERAHRAERAAA
ncbi:MAG TPA: metalloregulator ArsR/SmtB family transcription factor [Caulobacteraceae bacterium]|jgi:ArsR family transcriptional regulator